jgi:hypothetical protein
VVDLEPAQVDDWIEAMLEARMDEPEPRVRLEVVEATMSSPILRHEPVEPAIAPALLPETPILPPMTVARRVVLEFELAIVVTVAVAASFVAADARVAVVIGSLGFAALGIRRIDRRVSFSFGEGFVGYRPDLGWPRGVQEDDDVRWNWRGSAAGSPPNQCAAER